MESGTTQHAVFDRLKVALETSDVETLLDLYAVDSRMTIVDRNKPPSAPMQLEGKEAISAFWRDVCAREMTHSVGHEVVGPDRLAFIEECVYPDGCRVMSSMTLGMRDGRIFDHLTVQAWDEVSCATQG